MNTEQGNKLIAEFVQLPKVTVYDCTNRRYVNCWDTYKLFPQPHGLGWINPGHEQHLSFHKDWNWLMYACKKFDLLPIPERKRKKRKTYEALCDSIDNAVVCYEIFVVWERLVGAIQWYNTQSPKQ